MGGASSKGLLGQASAIGVCTPGPLQLEVPETPSLFVAEGGDEYS